MSPDIGRGEVWWCRFGPSVGGTRPAIVMSNDYANRAINRVQVVPVTSRVEHVYPGEAFVTLNGQKRKAMAHQLTTVAKERLSERLAKLSPTDVHAVELAIRKQLAL